MCVCVCVYVCVLYVYMSSIIECHSSDILHLSDQHYRMSDQVLLMRDCIVSMQPHACKVEINFSSRRRNVNNINPAADS